MATLSGNGGLLKIDTTTVAEMTGWKVDISRKVLDDTVLADTWDTSIAGRGSWKGSGDGIFAVHTDTAGQTTLNSAMLAGTIVSLRFYVDSTHYFAGTAFIDGLGVVDDAGDVVKISFSFIGSGALTYN